MPPEAAHFFEPPFFKILDPPQSTKRLFDRVEPKIFKAFEVVLLLQFCVKKILKEPVPLQ